MKRLGQTVFDTQRLTELVELMLSTGLAFPESCFSYAVTDYP
jgi:hypothetical protein